MNLEQLFKGKNNSSQVDEFMIMFQSCDTFQWSSSHQELPQISHAVTRITVECACNILKTRNNWTEQARLCLCHHKSGSPSAPRPGMPFLVYKAQVELDFFWWGVSQFGASKAYIKSLPWKALYVRLESQPSVFLYCHKWQTDTQYNLSVWVLCMNRGRKVIKQPKMNTCGDH